MSELSIDFETRSDVDLQKEGAYRYATDPSTHVYMMSWAFDDEPVQCWVPSEQPFPDRVENHIMAGGIINAWNSQFERLIFEYVLCNDIFMLAIPKPEQFHCSAARARAHGMPGKLGDCARAMDAKIQKMTEGPRLIREYCAKNVLWDDIPRADQLLMKRYCDIDVETERGLANMLRPLSDDEWYEFLVNEHINDLGVPLDMDFASAAAKLSDHVRDTADAKIAKLTHGAVTTARQRNTRDAWVLPRLTDSERGILQTGKAKNNNVKYSFEQTRRALLAAEPDLDCGVREYLEYVGEAGGATMRKYEAMKNKSLQNPNDYIHRLHGALLFNGAGQTGRFSSMGLQLHNLSRDTLPEPEKVMAKVLAGTPLDSPHHDLKRLVRSCITHPEGLTWYDWSNIEGRIAPWLADSPTGREKLQLYIDGIDPYIYNAAKTFRVPMDQVTKDQRQAGKLQELALQFLGGVGALRMMGVNYGIKITNAEAEMYRDAWRAANPWAIDIGNKMNRAAMRAMQRPQRWQDAGRLRFIYDGGDWLWMELPSGRLLAYHKPRIELTKTPWGDEIHAVVCVWGAGKPKHGEPWLRRAMHRGLWLENATQATAADVLREAVIRVDDSGLDIVLHVHDEIIVEGKHEEELADAMLVPPTWSTGLPIVGAGGSGERYGK